MRPLPRILLNAATALSTLLCVTTVVLWARCYCRSDCLTRHRAAANAGSARDDQVSFVSDGGRLGYVLREVRAQGLRCDEYVDPARAASGLPYWTRQASDESPPGWLDETTAAGWGPIQWSRTQSGGVYVFERARAVGVSHWVFVALFAPLPLLRWKGHRERARRALLTSRLCRSCGYDLRASFHRCPECGMPVFSAI
jgi:hypothetical protein